jgi:hypothetical protein
MSQCWFLFLEPFSVEAGNQADDVMQHYRFPTRLGLYFLFAQLGNLH